MSLRSLITVVSCVLALGCSAVSEDSALAPTGGGAAPQLELTADATLYLLPGETRELGARYLDEAGAPVSGVLVTFGLWNGASGASLSPAEAATDQAGLASATLRAGSTPSMFEVRVSAEGVAPAYFMVTVGPPVAPSVRVSVSYRGKRNIASRSVTLVPSMTCDQLTQVVKEDVRTELSYVLFQPDAEAPFNLGSGLSYAIVAWGSDDTNSKLAYGCVDIDARPTANAEEAAQTVDVLLEDSTLNLAPGGFNLSFALDVSLPLGVLKGSAEQAVFERLPKKPQPGAGFYLDFLEGSLGSFSALRSSAALDQELETLLDQANGGPLTFAAQLAQLVLTQGAKANVQARLDIPAQNTIGTLVVSSIDALAVDTARSLPLTGALAATSTLDARYDADLAAIVVDSLSIELGLGSYAASLLQQSGAAADVVKQLAPSHGCPQVRLLVTRHPSLPFTASQAEAACEQAAATLVSTVATTWPALDAERSTLWFQGNVPVHARDMDRKLGPRDVRSVDDVGPATLSASWSTSYSAEADDAVVATLRVPPTTALAL